MINDQQNDLIKRSSQWWQITEQERQRELAIDNALCWETLHMLRDEMASHSNDKPLRHPRAESSD